MSPLTNKPFHFLVALPKLNPALAEALTVGSTSPVTLIVPVALALIFIFSSAIISKPPSRLEPILRSESLIVNNIVEGLKVNPEVVLGALLPEIVSTRVIK